MEHERLLEFKQSVSLIRAAQRSTRVVSEIAIRMGAGGDERVELYKAEQQCPDNGSHGLLSGNKRMRERGCAHSSIDVHLYNELPAR